ncbi:MAG: sugar MFS transporter [Dysgonamonadaceae bacterium]|jgi:glucose/galactose transporter|nr:sugar MFS transporter [Dysgonamonadaceae bacterium]
MTQTGKLSKRNFIISIAILAFMYFVFGFVSWINAILIPYFKIACELSNFESYLVAFAFYIAYLVMSMPGACLLKKVGFKRGIVLGFFILASGALIFVPAAMTRTYGIFLTGLFTMGTGLAVLQTAANPYVTIIGPLDKAVQRMSIMGVCNKFAGIVSPLIFAAFTLKATDKELFAALPAMTEAARSLALDELVRRVILPYSCLSVLLIGVGLFIRYSSLPEINTEEENEELTESCSGKSNIFQFPYLILGALALFLHVGTQVIAIDTIIGYATSMGMDLISAKTFPSFTLTATIVGYIVGIVCVPRFIGQTDLLRICTVTGLLLSFCILFIPGHIVFKGYEIAVSIWFVVLLGLPNALIYAGIWPLAIRNLGRFTKIGSSILVMGLAGNAILPLIYGHCVDWVGTRQAYWVLVPCFLYLVFYAVYGYKITSWKLR